MSGPKQKIQSPEEAPADLDDEEVDLSLDPPPDWESFLADFRSSITEDVKNTIAGLEGRISQQLAKSVTQMDTAFQGRVAMLDKGLTAVKSDIATLPSS